MNKETSKIYEKTEYTWVTEFSELLDRYETGTCKESSVFPKTVGERQYCWKLKFYPNGDKEFDDSELNVSLFLCPASTFECFAKFSFVLKNSKDEVIMEEKMECTFLEDAKGHGFSSLVSHEIIKTSLQEDNVIKIGVIVWAEVLALQSYHLPEIHENQISELKLSRELNTMFQSNTFSDFVFKFRDGSEIKVHRCVLAARSLAFAAMFQQDAAESKSGSARITDVEKETMVTLLNFLYTGTVDDLTFDRAKELASAANKYQLDDLKRHCGNLLADHLNFSNAFEILQFADRHHLSELKKKASEYIAKCKKFSYPSTLFDHTRLITELYLQFKIK